MNQSNKIPLLLLLSISIFWIIAAIKPLNRYDWFLENILFFIFLVIFICTYKKFRFSNISYFFITLFSILHLTGAHYSYSQVPFGHKVSEILNYERNHFDRAVHFIFGLLLTYPLKEFLIRTTNLRGILSYLLPFFLITAFSAIFEIIEWLLVIKLPPELGEAYLGMQNDRWDAQKDMLLASMGSAVALLALYVSSVKKKS